MRLGTLLAKARAHGRGIAQEFLRCHSHALERLGVHVMPAHFYSPIPAKADLADSVFERVSECVGVDWNLGVQERYLREVFPRYATEVEFPKNPGLSPADAAVLHAMIRHHGPAKIVEIGSGHSTRFAGRACTMNAAEGRPAALIAIEPYPAETLKAGLPGLTRLLEKKVQDVPLEEITDADLLFIDSSHVIRTGGDVTYEILEIVPRLKAGALVHWHDIVLPGEYWKDWVKGRHLFFTEQYLLQAFLQFNREFEVVWAARYMQVHRADSMAKVFPYFDPQAHRLMSFWIRRAGPGAREA